MLAMFNIPNLFTAANMLCGVLSIILSVSGRIDLAPFAVFLGAVFDFFDGFLARALKKQGELGKQLDSLADMVTFGLAPGVMMLVVLTYSIYHGNFSDMLAYSTADTSFTTIAFYSFRTWAEQLGAFSHFSWIPFLALLIPFFSLFRLAKFNIDTRQSESFIGVPTPANTIFFCAFPLLLWQYAGSDGWQHELIMSLVQPAVLVPVIALMSVLLVSEIPLFSLKFKKFSWQGNEIRYVFLIICVILIPVLLFWSVPIIVLLYIVLSVIENIFFKNKTHEIQS